MIEPAARTRIRCQPGLLRNDRGSSSGSSGSSSECMPTILTKPPKGSALIPYSVSPSRQAGLQVGDTVVAFNGRPVSNFTQLGDAIRAVPAWSPVTITVKRDGKLVTLNTVAAGVPGRSGSFLGIGPAVLFQIPSLLGAIEYSGTTFGQVVVGSGQAVTELPGGLSKLFSKERSSTPAGQVTSIVGAAQATGTEVASGAGWQTKVSFVLLLIAALNIFFGLFNLLPLLPMDGGHIAVIIYERIRAWVARLRGRPDPGLADIAKFLPVSFSLFVGLVLISLVVISADIVNPINLTGG